MNATSIEKYFLKMIMHDVTLLHIDAKAAEAAQSAYYDPNRPQCAYVPPPAYYVSLFSSIHWRGSLDFAILVSQGNPVLTGGNKKKTTGNIYALSIELRQMPG